MNAAFRRGLRVSVSLVIVFTGTLLSHPGSAAGVTTLAPNLRMHRIEHITIQVVNGRRLLRFDSLMPNVGDGPFEIVGSRANAASPMRVSQFLYNSAGQKYAYPTGARLQWAGDGHNHWHTVNGITYEVYPTSGTLTVRRGAKIGFCFVDSNAYALGLENAPRSPVYTSGCGNFSALRVREGVSVGWADLYPWNFAYQWIDITGLAGGTYRLRATADQPNYFYETNSLDNCVYATIVIPSTGSNVQVLGRGDTCGKASITPVRTFPGGTAINPSRRVIFTPGTYVGYRFNSIGTTLVTKSMTLATKSGANTSYRAIPFGQPSNWLYITNGGLAGYWVKDTASVNFAP
ncbi:MAG TPA: lysyl oxidase family protein [Candidatus Limnocylindria bacterium]|nr:lysyl oxidase family protein [Candidatus Limnocylindria bacterium]